MRTAKRGLISNILLVKKTHEDVREKNACEPYLAKIWIWLTLACPRTNTAPGASLSLPHRQKHLQKRVMLRETRKLCLITSVLLTLEMVTLTFISIYWQTPSYSQMNTFLPINITHFGLLLIASNFYSQRIPARLGFITQPSQTMWNMDDLQSSLCKKGISPQKQRPGFTPGLDISLFAGFQWVLGASISLKLEWRARNHTNYLGPLEIIPSFSRSRWNNLGSAIGSMFSTSELLNSY